MKEDESCCQATIHMIYRQKDKPNFSFINQSTTNPLHFILLTEHSKLPLASAGHKEESLWTSYDAILAP
jgi:hypothetical protein